MTALLLGGMANQVRAIKVTYHILTLPMNSANSNTLAEVDGNRVEAVRYTSESTSLVLPDFVKSPLAKNYRFYASSNVNKTAQQQIYYYMVTKYDLYTITNPTDSLHFSTAPLTELAENCDIYVTYEYDAANTVADLTGQTEYNIKLGQRFLAYNMERGNRPAGIPIANVTNENLNSQDPTYVANCGISGKSYHTFHFSFLLEGSDPYNITIRTAYKGNATYFTDGDKTLNYSKVLKWYKGASLFSKGSSNGNDNMWLASDDNYQFTNTSGTGEVTYNKIPGYYRGAENKTNLYEMNPIFNSFALMGKDASGGLVFMGSRINTNNNNYQPNSSGQYFYLTLTSDGNNAKYSLKAPANAESVTLYKIKEYTYKVKTPLSNTVLTADARNSEYNASTSLVSLAPDVLKRKYASFTGAYSNEDLAAEHAISTFTDAEQHSATENGKKVVWLKYTSSMPFESLPVGGSYTDARWYTLRMNGDHEDQYIVWYDATNNRFNTGGGSNSDLHAGESTPEAMFAFIGDPYELKIINRDESEKAPGNRYIGYTTDDDPTLLSLNDGTSGVSNWEIVDDNEVGTMVLREVGTATTTPMYIGWNYGESGNPIYYKTSSSRIKIVELGKKKYYYHIVRADGSVAVMASAMQDVGIPVKYANIPDAIRSPFIDPAKYGATVTFYATLAHATAGTPTIANTPYNVTETENKDIYVRYSFPEPNPLAHAYNHNVRLNGQYLYNDGGSENPNIKTQVDDPGDSDTKFAWSLSYEDPYAMTISNVDAGKYIKVDSWANEAVLNWGDVANASKFVVKGTDYEGVYEVMAATGDGVDASVTNYNIGRSDVNVVRMYSNSTYPHNYAQLRFVLTLTNAAAVDYHLIDKAHHELLVVRSRRSDLFFPADYRSPLVDVYHYYASNQFTVTNGVYALVNSPTELANLEAVTADAGVKHVYVTYDTNNRLNLQKGALYLLQFEIGDSFKQENGSDGFTSSAVQGVYPYCNGDCNFFVYGNDEYDTQQQGAASTRTRWAWFLESTNNDPYHVKICSRQTETFNNVENRGYFRTYSVSYGGLRHVVTTLAWPGITGEQGTEYMVLGAVGQYQLVTTNKVDVNDDGDTTDPEDTRQTVKSFEQYWKTFDTIRKKVFGDNVANADLDIDDPTTVPATPLFDVTTDAGKASNIAYLEEKLGFHHYSHWAYAKRWNGFNISGAKSKGWEQIDHWYQTVNMGEGVFNFVETEINPVLILLDQHGWEIMRKPLPNSPDDETKAAKYNAIRPYNSPMVKEYYFWTGAKKRSGFHQYYDLSGQIKVGGKVFSSTSLTTLPDYYEADGSRNATLFDKKGNHLDEYVTYTVKEEYAQSYNPVNESGVPFLIQQGDKYASTADGATVTLNTVADPGGMSQTIIANNNTFTGGGTGDQFLWYVKPNTNIDAEMGYGSYSHNWDNAYTGSTATTGFNSNGFDPYNIQISNKAFPEKYFVSNATEARLEDASTVGDGTAVSLASIPAPENRLDDPWYDSRKLAITNATFMAVQDANGNMQLMPRFDQNKRVRLFGSLVTPTQEAGDPTKLPQTYTKLFRPAVYHYYIIDNDGNESLRYDSGGDLVPQTPDHFKSPLAKDFKYYKTLMSTGDYTYNLTTLANEVTESFAGKDMTAKDNNVYVRYAYNEDADTRYVLKGKWLTMQIDQKNTQYTTVSATPGLYTGSKPATVDKNARSWQWKFLETPQSEPDPYAVCLYNRSQAAGTKADSHRFALLNHTSGDYALAVAGLGSSSSYNFLKGNAMTDAVAATTNVAEAGFTSTSCAFSGTDSQVKMLDEVVHEYEYKIFTNAGVLAISDIQTQSEASANDFVPEVPSTIQSPLLDISDYLYYETQAKMDTEGMELDNLYGLYEDEVYVRYKLYQQNKSEYKVPNARNNPGSDNDPVDVGEESHDTPIALNGRLFYNIIWKPDNMMKSNDTGITYEADKELQPGKDYQWTFDGDDPYAIKIKSLKENTFIHDTGSNTCDLNAEPTTFMMLPKSGYKYGVLAKTGDKTTMLSGYGNTLTTSDPEEYVIFALSTLRVIYHLVIANIGSAGVDIPYFDKGTLGTLNIHGTTKRDLTSTTGDPGATAGDKYQLGTTINGQTYSYDAGRIGLGDVLKIPTVFYRPNVFYTFVIEGVYNDIACTDPNSDMNNLYKGHEVENMGDDEGLLGMTVRINVVYSFEQGLETNSGNDFVKSVNENKWYTFEAKKDDGTPLLAQWTNAWFLEVKEGRGTHYTNDYLWSPIGDPYGFKMYHRYTYVNSGNDNSGEPNRVMTTNSVVFTADEQIMMGSNDYSPDDPAHQDAKSVYELLEAETPGYFRVHPVANMDGTQYYLGLMDGTDSSGAAHKYVKLRTTATEFTFGLTEDLLKPYYDRAGYVGGLNAAGKKAYEDAKGDLMALQGVVYNPDYIIKYTPGYYRLHSPSDIEGVAVRYASGYTHLIESTNYDNDNTEDADGDGINTTDILPMHFYESKGVSTSFENLNVGTIYNTGYTQSVATRGELPIVSPEYDPASIFYFYEGTSSVPYSRMSTQGLYVKGRKGQVYPGNIVENYQESEVEEATERAAALMTSDPSQATKLYVMDIGGAILLIHDWSTVNRRSHLKYLSFDQNDDATIYDLKLTHNTHTDHAKWLMQRVNEVGLYITTHNSGDTNAAGTTTYYTTFYAPFDILLPNDDKDKGKTYKAYVCTSDETEWGEELRMKPIGDYHTGTYEGNDKFVPAGTPVLIATTDNAGYIKVTLPNSTPSAPIPNNLLSGQYLEQKLALDATQRIYSFGLPYSGELTLNPATGNISASLATQDNRGKGFYLNANPYKENGPSRGDWIRNNWYVYGNKVYYHATGVSPSRQQTRGADFIPVIFDDGDEEQEIQEGGRQRFDRRAYDLQGRCVASVQQVADGTWRLTAKPGIYIVAGKKIVIR